MIERPPRGHGTRPRPSIPARARRRRAIGIMGGNFDPIHHATFAAPEVMTPFGLDQVVPAFRWRGSITRRSIAT